MALVPITLALHYALPHRDVLIFLLSAASMVPLAHLLSEATEQLSVRTGASIGALLNVTFGNAGELVIGFFALRAGLQGVVKASISGSILANLLLTLGISMLVAGTRKRQLTFNPLSARTQSTMLALGSIALILPAAYHFLGGRRAGARETDLSLEFAIILLVTYGLSLLFRLRTHRDLLAARKGDEQRTEASWSPAKALAALAGSAALIGWVGEVLVSSIDAAAQRLGMTELFVGIVVVAIAGNAAEAVSAVRAALGNRMDLCVGIAVGSSIQVALFVAPVLILLSHFNGPHPMDLVFTPVEIVALVIAIAITGQIAGDGDSNWLEGVQLLAVYFMLAVMFYLIPAGAAGH